MNQGAFSDPLLLTAISKNTKVIRVCISNHIHVKVWDVTICPVPNFNGDLAKPQLKLDADE